MMLNMQVDNKDKTSRWIFPGTTTLPFKYRLPADLPHSLTDSKIGDITYLVYMTSFGSFILM
jgi:hypothetical protein